MGNRLKEKLAGRKVRVQLEMGGKNPTIVLKDADLDYAADILVNGAFFSTGQKCTACSRAIIEKDIYEALVEKLVAKTRSLKVGNGSRSPESRSARPSMKASSKPILNTSRSPKKKAPNCCAAAIA